MIVGGAVGLVASGQVDGQSLLLLGVEVLRVQFIQIVPSDVGVLGQHEVFARAPLHQVIVASLQTLSDALEQADDVLVRGQSFAQVLVGAPET